MNTQKKKLILGVLGFFVIAAAAGCAFGRHGNVRKAVKAELNQLKSSESQTIVNCINTQDLLPASLESDAVSQDIAEVFTLFYDDFSFRVKNVSVKDGRAIAKIRIKNLDTEALAKDFASAALTQHIEHSVQPEDSSFSANDSYLLLKELLQTQKYRKQITLVEIPLEKNGDNWQIIHSTHLDNQLTGNFFSHVTDPNLLSPSQIIKIHFDVIKEFTPEQIKQYFNLEQLLEENNYFYGEETLEELSKQISIYFDYEIKDETIDKNRASVNVTITGADSKSTDTEILLVNDGVNWKIQTTPEISHAIIGDALK